MPTSIRIGTRDSQLALWQATQVQRLLADHGYASELVPIKSEGDIDLSTPLYEIGVQGIFTRTLDIALLSNKIDIAVHSMKDVPTQLPKGIVQAAVLERGNHKDILVHKGDISFLNDSQSKAIIATSSIRRAAQWLHKYPNHTIVNLRGNVNTRLRKLEESNWNGAIFAAAGLERIGLRPTNSIELDWMLPAPAQGAIMVVCRANDSAALDACSLINDTNTAICVKMERDYLRALMGGCTTPISAYARKSGELIHFNGSIASDDGKELKHTQKVFVDTRSFISIQPLPDEQLRPLFEKYRGRAINAVVTSKNAERIVKRFRTDEWKIFSITNQSVHYGGELADVIIQSGIKEVVFFCGNKRRDELPDKLRANGIQVEEVVVYENKETPHAITEEYDGLIFSSPSAVRSFFAANSIAPEAICYAIGETTAAEIRRHCNNQVEIGDFKNGIL